jgi:hypothetical protein
MKQSASDRSLQVCAQTRGKLTQGLSNTDPFLVLSMLSGSTDTLVPFRQETVVGGRSLSQILELGPTEAFCALK